jgi:hypothetical protein
VVEVGLAMGARLLRAKKQELGRKKKRASEGFKARSNNITNWYFDLEQFYRRFAIN